MNINRRSHWLIAKFVSELFYGGKLKHRDEGKDRWEPVSEETLKIVPVSFPEEGGCDDEGKSSYRNYGELDMILRQIDAILNEPAENEAQGYRYNPEDLFVLSPYKLQVLAIEEFVTIKAILNDFENGVMNEEALARLQRIVRNWMEQKRFSDQRVDDFIGNAHSMARNKDPFLDEIHYMRTAIKKTFDVKNLRNLGPRKISFEEIESIQFSATVDSIQGQENKVVIVSFARSNPEKAIGFLKTYDAKQRINVAVSRAQERLIIIWDPSTLLHHALFQKMFSFKETLYAEAKAKNLLIPSDRRNSFCSSGLEEEGEDDYSNFEEKLIHYSGRDKKYHALPKNPYQRDKVLRSNDQVKKRLKTSDKAESLWGSFLATMNRNRDDLDSTIHLAELAIAGLEGLLEANPGMPELKRFKYLVICGLVRFAEYYQNKASRSQDSRKRGPYLEKSLELLIKAKLLNAQYWSKNQNLDSIAIIIAALIKAADIYFKQDEVDAAKQVIKEQIYPFFSDKSYYGRLRYDTATTLSVLLNKFKEGSGIEAIKAALNEFYDYPDEGFDQSSLDPQKVSNEIMKRRNIKNPKYIDYLERKIASENKGIREAALWAIACEVVGGEYSRLRLKAFKKLLPIVLKDMADNPRTQEEILVDFHRHTDASDGEDTVEAMLIGLMYKGYYAAAITDHSVVPTDEALEEESLLHQAIKEHNQKYEKHIPYLKLIPGIEITVLLPKEELSKGGLGNGGDKIIHLLVFLPYNFREKLKKPEKDLEVFIQKLGSHRKIYEQQFDRTLEGLKIREPRFEISADDINKVKRNNLYPQLLWDILWDKYRKELREAGCNNNYDVEVKFNQGWNRLTDEDKKNCLSLEEVIEFARRTGSLIAIPHPHSLPVRDKSGMLSFLLGRLSEISRERSISERLILGVSIYGPTIMKNSEIHNEITAVVETFNAQDALYRIHPLIGLFETDAHSRTLYYKQREKVFADPQAMVKALEAMKDLFPKGEIEPYVQQLKERWFENNPSLYPKITAVSSALSEHAFSIVRRTIGAAVNTLTSSAPASPITMEKGLHSVRLSDVQAAGSVLVKKFELKALPDSSLCVNEISFKPQGASSSVNNKGPPRWTLKAFSFTFNGSSSLLSLLIIPPDFIPAENLIVVGWITPLAVLPAFYCFFLRPQSPRGEENRSVTISMLKNASDAISSPLEEGGKIEMSLFPASMNVDLAYKILQKPEKSRNDIIVLQQALRKQKKGGIADSEKELRLKIRQAMLDFSFAGKEIKTVHNEKLSRARDKKIKELRHIILEGLFPDAE